MKIKKELNIEELLEKTGSKYVLATAIFKRAKEINSGGKILVDSYGRKPEIIALQEIASGHVEIDFDPNRKPEAPLETKLEDLL